MITTILSLSLALGHGPMAPAAAPPATLGAPLDVYAELYVEYKAASRAYRTALREARQAGQLDQFHASAPIKTFFARFEALAKGGSPDALLFCALGVQELERPEAEVRAFKAAAFERLSTEFVTHPIIEKVISKIGRQEKWLSEKQISSALGRIAKEGKGDVVKSEASYKLARRMEELGTAFGLQRAKELYSFVQAKFPETRAAKRCAARVAGLRLAPGNEAPNFDAVDTDGNAFKLSDYRGKVVVLDFWGFW